MGMANSKTDFGEGEMITPPRTGTHKRVMDHEFDPRSPSVAITRTPIVVEKTPESLLDPRSPSGGIVRTPIITIMPESRLTQDKVPLMPNLVDEGADDQDDKLEDTDELLREFDSLHQMSIAEKISSEDAVQYVYKDQIETTVHRKPVKPTQPKQLFPKRPISLNKDNTRSPLATRTVDMNSPRVIIHKKQTKRLETAKSCVQEVIGSGRYCVQEKENVEY
ncbi:cell division cycle-associated protein 3-like [Mizuhopecten yessoensis]|uniref:Cell division cycle-associated protein 3 n=1 Tax=Mizuhopecten yessoensis TaxID=6573 RepID=A0A210PTL3_MIZYE|nr:cell division cycle-associated protein 3-like [Mizuhopecten yessoensis]XP_021375470.1 cell division cycle-associated protein 3-like [Mizuhopecten yessoensis]OWF39839.1 Cell division cycle-associated protein 3 [Mizuhopecten yessoensis]